MSSPLAGQRSRSRSRDRSSSPSEDHHETRWTSHGSRQASHERSRSPARRPDSSRNRSYGRGYRDRNYSPSPSPDHPASPRSAKIVIEKLTKNVNVNHLYEVFGSYGEIEELEMPTNRQFMMNKGIAYILYANSDQAAEAIAHMHEAQLDGALISVSIVLPRRRFSRSPPPKRPPPNRFGEPHRFRDGSTRHSAPDRSYGTRSGYPHATPPYRNSRRNSPPISHSSGRNGEQNYRDRFESRHSYRSRSISPGRPLGIKSGRSPNRARDRRSWSRSLSPDRRK